MPLDSSLTKSSRVNGLWQWEHSRIMIPYSFQQFTAACPAMVVHYLAAYVPEWSRSSPAFCKTVACFAKHRLSGRDQVDSCTGRGWAVLLVGRSFPRPKWPLAEGAIRCNRGRSGGNVDRCGQRLAMWVAWRV